MPIEPIPPYSELLWPTLQAIQRIGGSGTIQEIDDAVIELVGFSDEQQNVLHIDGPKSEIAYRLAWCRTYLKKADALQNTSRGVWAITEHGRQLTQAEVELIQGQVLQEYRRRREGDSAPDAAEDESDRDQEGWREELLDTLLRMEPDAFERLAQRLLREAGFISVEVTGRSGDGGIDGVGVLRVNLLSFPIFFQCKRYRGSVTPGAVRDFRGAMAGRGDKGLLITTGSFTRDAKAEATREGTVPIDLIDGDRLCDLLLENRLGVVVETVEQVDISSEWFEELA